MALLTMAVLTIAILPGRGGDPNPSRIFNPSPISTCLPGRGGDPTRDLLLLYLLWPYILTHYTYYTYQGEEETSPETVKEYYPNPNPSTNPNPNPNQGEEETSPETVKEYLRRIKEYQRMYVTLQVRCSELSVVIWVVTIAVPISLSQ